MAISPDSSSNAYTVEPAIFVLDNKSLAIKSFLIDNHSILKHLRVDKDLNV